jgi:predicted nucleotidyltransferase
LGELVFVGGCVTTLLITDEAASAPRITLDVDAIAEITSYAEYADFGNRLRALGFKEDTSEGAPLCRWTHGRTILDVMPLDEKILGFSNRWYRAAMESSVRVRLSADLEIRAVTAPFFIATKLEAFKGRGMGDFLGSHDLEDLVSVFDGRETLSAKSGRIGTTSARTSRLRSWLYWPPEGSSMRFPDTCFRTPRVSRESASC